MRSTEPGLGRRGILFIVSGPSGAGKSSLSDWVLENMPELVLSVSMTTRARRAGERDGEHYHFVGAGRFDQLVADGGLAEWAEVHGHRYGTPKEPIEEARAHGRDVLLDIDVHGAKQIRSAYADAVSVFLLPPSREALATRLATRGTDSEETVRRRLDNACREIRALSSYDYVIVNDVLETTCQTFGSIVAGQRASVARLDPDKIESLVRSFEGG